MTHFFLWLSFFSRSRREDSRQKSFLYRAGKRRTGQYFKLIQLDARKRFIPAEFYQINLGRAPHLHVECFPKYLHILFYFL